jgi:hypothetical protein
MTARMKPNLHAVPDVPQPQPSTAYEHEQRRYILSRDWAGIHIRSFRAAPIFLPDPVKRLWAR